MKRLPTDQEKKFRNIGKLWATYEILQANGFVMSMPRRCLPDEDYIKHGAHVDGHFVLQWECAACGKKYAANSMSAMRIHSEKCKGANDKNCKSTN